jgi:hypothetical protein
LFLSNDSVPGDPPSLTRSNVRLSIATLDLVSNGNESTEHARQLSVLF